MDIFVSYSSSDKTIADAVVATLERAQVRCWYAPRDILAGKPYGDAILDGLQASRGVVVIVSRRALASPHVLREVERAIHYGLVVVPFRIENVEMKGAFELFLSVSHWLDAMTPPLEQHLERLTDAVRGILSIKTVPPAPSVDAPVRAVAAGVAEVSPDLWSRRSGGKIRQFVSRFLEDTES
jgi:TIR domain